MKCRAEVSLQSNRVAKKGYLNVEVGDVDSTFIPTLGTFMAHSCKMTSAVRPVALAAKGDPWHGAIGVSQRRRP